MTDTRDGTVDLEPSSPGPLDFGEATKRASSKPPETTVYDPRVQHDRVRLIITGALLGIAAAVVIGAFVMSAWALGPHQSLEENRKTIVMVLNIVFGPVIALLGSVIGFYFGSGANKTMG